MKKTGTKKVKKVGEYVLGKTIGKGSYGKVKRAVHSQTLSQVAVKIINIKGQNSDIEKEISMLKLLKHPNIVKLIDVIREEGKIYIILELITGGELFDRIVNEGQLTESDARKLFRQMISVIEYCHGNLIAHRDLKPENILLDGDGNVKVTDFGLSNFIKPGEYLQTSCGSPVYAAPEVIMNYDGYIGTKSDIWSLGVVLFAMAAGYLPWEVDTRGMIKDMEALIAGSFEVPDHLSKEVTDLLRKMIEPNPAIRATMQEVKTHPWVNIGYAFPPPCYLEHRSQGVDKVNEEVLKLLVPLEFDIAVARTSILLNEQCLATSIYHLFLEQIAPAKQTTLPKISNQYHNPARRLSFSLGDVPPPTSVKIERSLHESQPLPTLLCTLNECDDIITIPEYSPSLPCPSSPTRSKHKLSQKVLSIFKRKTPTPSSPASPPPVVVAPRGRRHSTDLVDPSTRKMMFELGVSVDEASMRTVKAGSNVISAKEKSSAETMIIVQDVLESLKVQFDKDGYIFRCDHESLPSESFAVNPKKTSAFQVVHFDVEVCRIKGEMCFGVRIKRSAGDVWAYKAVFIQVATKLQNAFV